MPSAMILVRSSAGLDKTHRHAGRPTARAGAGTRARATGTAESGPIADSAAAVRCLIAAECLPQARPSEGANDIRGITARGPRDAGEADGTGARAGAAAGARAEV